MNPDDPAFPLATVSDKQREQYVVHQFQSGMTLRAYFAIKALQGMLANPWTAAYLKEEFYNANVEGQWYVTQAVHAADALIEELNKETKP